MLGMPSREYYLTETDSEYKAAYLRYMISMAKLFGADETRAVRDMQDVLHFEELLANVSITALLVALFLFTDDISGPDRAMVPGVRRNQFLANVNSHSRSLYAIARPFVVCLSVCSLSSVCL